MAKRIFNPFGDFETRGYLRNTFGEKDLDVVKKLEHNFFEANLVQAVQFLGQASALNYLVLLETHKRIFEGLYPWAGQDRMVLTPDKTVSKGSITFANPEEIETIVGLSLNKTTPGEVLGGLALAHPFLDGNGRALALFFGEHQRRKGRLIRWDLIPKREYLNSLGDAINGHSNSLNRLLNEYSQTPLFRKPTPEAAISTLKKINWAGRRENKEQPQNAISNFIQTISAKISRKTP